MVGFKKYILSMDECMDFKNLEISAIISRLLFIILIDRITLDFH